MSDFHQSGELATLHALSRGGVARLEAELEQRSKMHPIALVLPALYSEFETGAMTRIREELIQVRYLSQIVVALDRATESQFDRVRSFFDDFQLPVTVIWNDGKPVRNLYRILERHDLPVGEEGKGRSCWMAVGFVLASQAANVIALHDCDIVNYDRRLLARLCYPVANPDLGFQFCKGYYARVADRMYGRVTRLFLTPLLRALLTFIPNQPFLEYLDSFRYPLAGEFALRTELARACRIPGHWGLELGVLAEVYRNSSVKRVCQADLTDAYEHKHQCLSEDDPGKGLARMCCDIALTLFRAAASEGIVLTDAMMRALPLRYARLAEDAIDRHAADALLNGLEFDRDSEERAVATFASSLGIAMECYCENPVGERPMANWSRVSAAIPDFFDVLLEAVEAERAVAA